MGAYHVIDDYYIMSSISENNKRIAKNTLLLYCRMFLIMTVALYTSRVVLETLGVEDYGIYNVVGGVVTMFTFINNSMAGATQRFFTFELGKNNKERLHQVFCSSITIHVIVSFIIFILAETVGLYFLNTYMSIPDERMYAAHWVYQMSVFSTIIMIMNVPFNAMIIAHERMSAFAYISVLEVILKLFIVYLLVLFHFDKLILYAVLLFGIQFLSWIIYGKYCRKHFEECFFQFYFDKNLFREMIGFAGWNMVGSLSVVAFTQGLNILLNIFFGPMVNAARTLAVQVQHAIQGFISNFQMALNPQIVKNYACGDLKQMYSLIYASSKYSFYLLFILSFPVILETNYLLSIWLVTVPDYTVNFVRLMLITAMVDVLANPLIMAAQATGKIKIYQIVVGSVLLLIVPISFIALKLGGSPEVVFIIHFIVVLIAQIIRLLMISSMIHLSIKDYINEVISKIIMVTIFSLIGPLIIKQVFLSLSFFSFIIVTVSCILFTSISIFYMGQNKNERSIVLSKIIKILK